MQTTEWHINSREAGLPLLEALRLRVPAAPNAFLRQLLKKQRISLNGQVPPAERNVLCGELIAVSESQRWLECLRLSRLRPEQILYEDQGGLVIDKPAGLPVHNAVGHADNLLNFAQEFLRLRGEKFQVAPVHRLDIGTSGAILFGKGRAEISRLGQAIMAAQVVKKYLALVEGRVTQAGTLTSAVPAKGRILEAMTRYRPLDASGSQTLLELELLTGRRHQIRHQLAKAGWPIIGDRRYGSKLSIGIGRPFLHCHHLAFPQPENDRVVVVDCPLAPELSAYLATIGLDAAQTTGSDRQNSAHYRKD